MGKNEKTVKIVGHVHRRACAIPALTNKQSKTAAADVADEVSELRDVRNFNSQV